MVLARNLVSNLPEDFRLLKNQSVTGTITLDSSELILDLLAMTPHYWHVKPEQKQELAKLQNLECEFYRKLYAIFYTSAES